MFRYILLLSIFISSLLSKDYLVAYSLRHDINTTKQYINFNKAFSEVLKNHKKNISNNWPNLDLSTPYKLVQYLNDYHSKIVFNFKKNVLSIEVISKNEKLAQEKIKLLILQALKMDVKSYLKSNFFNKKLYSKLQLIDSVNLSNNKIITNLDANMKTNIINNIQLQEFKKIIHNDKVIYKVFYKLPKTFTQDKFKTYKNIMNKYSNKNNIPKELLYSIIHINTYFNPLGIDYKNMTYGLAQLNPKKNASIAYTNITNNKKFITPRYLYDSVNNINLSSQYLSILFNDKFKNIKNINSRIYCTIIAYKLNVKTIQDIFEDDKEYKNINNLLASRVYKTILRKLKNNKDKLYFSKIVLKIKN